MKSTNGVGVLIEGVFRCEICGEKIDTRADQREDMNRIYRLDRDLKVCYACFMNGSD